MPFPPPNNFFSNVAHARTQRCSSHRQTRRLDFARRRRQAARHPAHAPRRTRGNARPGGDGAARHPRRERVQSVAVSDESGENLRGNASPRPRDEHAGRRRGNSRGKPRSRGSFAGKNRGGHARHARRPIPDAADVLRRENQRPAALQNGAQGAGNRARAAFHPHLFL